MAHVPIRYTRTAVQNPGEPDVCINSSSSSLDDMNSFTFPQAENRARESATISCLVPHENKIRPFPSSALK